MGRRLPCTWRGKGRARPGSDVYGSRHAESAYYFGRKSLRWKIVAMVALAVGKVFSKTLDERT